MSRLTVTEKEHWKDRIARRIDKATAAIEAAHPELRPDITTKAEKKVLESLGILAQHNEIQCLREDADRKKAEAEELEKRMHQDLLGIDTCKRLGEHTSRHRFREMKNNQQSIHEEELLRASDPGRKILNLRTEREALIDTVWLATSSNQIRDLWSRVSEVLGEESTPLQESIVKEVQSSPST